MNIRKKEGIYFLVLLLAIIALSYNPQFSPDCGECTEWVDSGCGAGDCADNEMKQGRTCTGDIFSDEKPVAAGQGENIIPLSPPKGIQFSLGEVPPECIKRCIIHENCQEEEQEEEEGDDGGNGGGDNEEINIPNPPREPIELPKYPDLHITTNIDNLSKELHPGDTLPINIILENTGDLNPIDINLNCNLVHENISFIDLEENYTLDTYKNLTKELPLPQNLTPGGYIFNCLITYEDYSDSWPNTIIITNPPEINEEHPSTFLLNLTLFVLSIIIILIIIIIFIKRKKKTKVSKNGNRKNRTTKTTRRKHKKSSRRNKNVRRRK